MGPVTSDAGAGGGAGVVAGTQAVVGFRLIRLWTKRGSPDVTSGDPRGPSEVGPGVVAIAVSPDLKADLVDRWEPVFGYSDRSLFPDLDGLARSHSAARAFDPGFFSDPDAAPPD